MGIVSIGEVVGSVAGGPSEPELTPDDETRAEGANATPDASQADAVQRELRVRAWRQTRLHAD
ncbi:hypothetical protein JRI60_28270 [Archangium violaceum]|uniref:hypothetical protein n=1 Tax=Archangium violaceum TaxID=83451 RepID=UPI00194E9521|nr:hypothetical protein [Archangium violaceum]QRN93100.1 hypothetical protein JRI60_28270 [Archangium violaceum]